jgi:hypothetical protein
MKRPCKVSSQYLRPGFQEAAGGNGYIEKPVNPETSVAEIDRFRPPSSTRESHEP